MPRKTKSVKYDESRKGIVTMDNRVTLEISCWKGISLGATHYYGSLVGYNNEEYCRYDIEKVMTQADAKRLSKKDSFKYREGNKTTRFETKEEIRQLALAQWKQLFPNGTVLLEGRSAYADPQKCLAATNQGLFEQLNALWKEYEKIPQVKQNYSKIDELCNRFDALIRGN